MKRYGTIISFIIITFFSLSGCSYVGQKSMSISIVYAFSAIFSLFLTMGYACFARNKNSWFLLLFSSVFLVNFGYLSLSLSTSLSEALLANRISYLGSVFLPLSMIMLIMDACNIKCKKWIPMILSCLGFVVFFVAASPGYLDIYYQSASLATVNGVTVLDKVYGPLHSIYLYYLMGYFASMTAIIAYATAKKRVKSNIHALVLLVAVFINIAVWLLEQLVKIDFEFLSISYIASELFLLCISAVYQENKPILSNPEISSNEVSIVQPAVTENQVVSPPSFEVECVDASENKEEQILSEKCKYFVSQLENLTPTEHTIYNLYLERKSTKEILEILNIKENTLKYHNKNIYSKLGVSSRKQLVEIAKASITKS